MNELLENIIQPYSESVGIVHLTDGDTCKTRNLSDVTKELKKQLSDLLSKTNKTNFDEMEHVFEHLGIQLDHRFQECVDGKTKAECIFSLTDESCTPLQTYWIKYSNLFKELNKEKDTSKQHNIKNKMTELRRTQHGLCCNLLPVMKRLIHFLADLEKLPVMMMIFVTQLKMLLERQSLKLLSDQGRNRSNVLGIEYLVREISQIYESVHDIKPLADEQFMNALNKCPSVAAKMLVKGQALEILDGDANNIPMTWISSVLKSLNAEIGDKRKVLVLSVLGLQSSGKSTLLNAMFGLQLAVSAGQCTRGVFMQLVPLPAGIYPFDYILVVDTEGLRAPERKGTGHEHDNQLATFVVGLADVTVMNVKGENTSEIGDILEIVVHAFLRLKQVSDNFQLQQSCIFVHQNVSNSTAVKKMLPGTLRLVQCLDEITEEAVRDVNVPNCNHFSEVIYFRSEKHVFHFPDLWCGIPPMCTVNCAYSENVAVLKKIILSDITERRKTYFTIMDIIERIKNLWDGILSEDFVYSYRNGIEIRAVRRVDAKIFQFRRHLESVSSEFMQFEAEDAFKSCNNENSLEKIKKEMLEKFAEIMDEKLRNIIEEFEKFIEEDPLKEIIIQWKEQKINRLRQKLGDLSNAGKIDINTKMEKYKLEIRQKIILPPHENAKWRNYAEEFTEQLSSFSVDKDICKRFGELWESNMQGLFQRQKPHLSIEDEMTALLWEYFETDMPYLTKERKRLDENRISNMTCLQDIFLLEHIKDKHLSSKRPRKENNALALKMTTEICRKLDEFIIRTEVRAFNIVVVRELFDIFVAEFDEKNKTAMQQYGFNLTTSYKAMLAAHISKYAVHYFQKVNEEYEKEHGLAAKQRQYKIKVLNHFRKLIKECMIAKTEREREQQILNENQKQQMQKDDICRAQVKIEQTKKVRMRLKKTETETGTQGNQDMAEEYLQREQKQLSDKVKLFFKRHEEKLEQQDIGTAKQIVDIVTECIHTDVLKWIPNQVVNEILSEFNFLKHNLIRNIMIDLAEHEDLDEYFSYINNTNEYVHQYIKKVTDKKLFEEKVYAKLSEKRVSFLFTAMEEGINATASSSFDDLQKWLSAVVSNVRKAFRGSKMPRFSLSTSDFAAVECIHVNDFQTLIRYLGINLQKSKSKCIEEFRKTTVFTSDWESSDLYLKIFTELWGCEACCPLCSEPCQNTEKNHPEKHTCIEHRPDGVRGWCDNDTKILGLYVCNVYVQSNDAFDCNRSENYKCKEHTNVEGSIWHPYRDFNTYAPDWDIAPDSSLKSSKYWSWYLYTFKDKLVERDRIKFPKMLDNWQYITKKAAQQSLLEK